MEISNATLLGCFLTGFRLKSEKVKPKESATANSASLKNIELLVCLKNAETSDAKKTLAEESMPAISGEPCLAAKIASTSLCRISKA